MVRLEVGSSMITTRASSESALTISSSCIWASDSVSDRRVGLEVDAQPIEQRLHPRCRTARSISLSGPP